MLKSANKEIREIQKSINEYREILNKQSENNSAYEKVLGYAKECLADYKHNKTVKEMQDIKSNLSMLLTENQELNKKMACQNRF